MMFPSRKRNAASTVGRSNSAVLLCVIAATASLAACRHTEDEGARVLILEAGPQDSSPLIQIPLGLGKLHQHRLFDWGYDAEPDANIALRSWSINWIRKPSGVRSTIRFCANGRKSGTS